MFQFRRPLLARPSGETPAITVPALGAQLTFRNNYNTQAAYQASV